MEILLLFCIILIIITRIHCVLTFLLHPGEKVLNKEGITVLTFLRTSYSRRISLLLSRLGSLLEVSVVKKVWHRELLRRTTVEIRFNDSKIRDVPSSRPWIEYHRWGTSRVFEYHLCRGCCWVEDLVKVFHYRKPSIWKIPGPGPNSEDNRSWYRI